MSDKKLEADVMALVSKDFFSISQVARELGIKKHVAGRILENLRSEGKLRMAKVGRSKVYTLSQLPKTRKKSRVIGLVSGKGGAGKTTVALNLAISSLSFTRDVIVVDADIKMSGIGLLLGVHNFPTTLNDALKGNVEISDALYHHHSGLKVIPASLAAEHIDASLLRESFYHPALEGNLIFVDSPPGLDEIALNVLKACNEIIIVVNPEIPSVTDAMKVFKVAKDYDVSPIGVIVNRYKKGDKDQMSRREIEMALELPIIGVIPEERRMRRSVHKRIPIASLYPNARSSIEFKKISAKILGVDYTPPNRFVRAIKNILRWGG
jgi:septum site-determining protein MinD